MVVLDMGDWTPRHSGFMFLRRSGARLRASGVRGPWFAERGVLRGPSAPKRSKAIWAAEDPPILYLGKLKI